MEPPEDDFESQYAEELEMMNEDNGKVGRGKWEQNEFDHDFPASSERRFKNSKTSFSRRQSVYYFILRAGLVAGPPSRRFLDLRSPCMLHSEISAASALSRKRPPSSESPLPLATSPGKYESTHKYLF